MLSFSSFSSSLLSVGRQNFKYFCHILFHSFFPCFLSSSIHKNERVMYCQYCYKERIFCMFTSSLTVPWSLSLTGHHQTSARWWREYRSIKDMTNTNVANIWKVFIDLDVLALRSFFLPFLSINHQMIWSRALLLYLSSELKSRLSVSFIKSPFSVDFYFSLVVCLHS